MTNSARSVLIVKFGAIGDCIMAIPAAYLLHQQGYQIFWACGVAVRPLLECYDWINIVSVDDRALLLGKLIARTKTLLRFWRQTSRIRYTLCATLYYDIRYRILVLPVQADRKFFLQNDVREARLLPGRHHADEWARLLLHAKDTCHEQSAIPVKPSILPPSPWQPSSAVRRIAIFPGGTSNLLRDQTLRRWPVERYVQMSENLLRRGWEVVLLGGAEDGWVTPAFRHLDIAISLGILSLPQVVSACNACDAVITHDTGPLHLAGLSETCLLGIFGPTDPATRVSRRPYASGLWGGRGFACRPCYDGRDFAPCQHNGCMHQVTVSDVLAELDRLLDRRDRGLETPWRIVEPKFPSEIEGQIDPFVSIQRA